MTSKTVKLFNPVLLDTTISSLYETPALKNTIVRKLGFLNTGTSVVEISVYIVPSGETFGAANQILKRKIAANESFEFLGAVNDVMNAGDKIQALCSVEGVVNVRGSGSEIVNS